MSGDGAAREGIEARLRARPLGGAGPRPAPGLHHVGTGRGDALLAVPPGDAPVPLLVMFHGAGADARQAVDLVAPEASERGVAVLASASLGGSWDVIERGIGPDVAVLDEALARVFATLPVDPGRVLIGGFSDGASYALTLGLANGDLFGAVLAFSPGFLAPPVLVGRPRVSVSHGVRDPVLPIAATTRRIVPILLEGGYDLRVDEFEGGHSVPPASVAAALDWALAAPMTASGDSG